MRSVDLLMPGAPPAVPFSVRLAEKQLQRPAAARSNRRSHSRRGGGDLAWLRQARLARIGPVHVVDLSEGGALIEVEAPLKLGTFLSLELSGEGLETTVPLEVLRCYVARLDGTTTIYRGACVFAYLIDLPRPQGSAMNAPVEARDFVGADVALAHLLKRCVAAASPDTAGARQVTLERTEILKVLEALLARKTAQGTVDPLNRYVADILTGILPALRRGAPASVVTAVLDERLQRFPERWRTRLQPTYGRLTSLIEHCAAPSASRRAPETDDPVAPPSPAPARAPASAPTILDGSLTAASATAFQKLVVRYADGRLAKGYSQDFHPTRARFSLWPSIGAAPKERTVVAVSQLKAVFFVRDFLGNPAHREKKAFTGRPLGRRLEITFADGERLLGTTLNYRADAQGFFVSPADASANNTRVYVVSSAVHRVHFPDA